MKGYFVPLDEINELQAAAIERSISRCKHAHHTDLQIRINGAYEYHEADWVKHMLSLPECDDVAILQMENSALRSRIATAERVIAYYQAEDAAKYAGAFGAQAAPERKP